MSREKYIMGIDIGGTNLRAGLVNSAKGLSEFTITSTKIMEDDNTVDNLISFVKDYLSFRCIGKDVSGIAIGFPSTIDRARRRVLSTPNIKGLNNINIVDRMEKELQIPIYIEKDVNMLLLYDMFIGNIPDAGITTGFYVGTGLGNAITINGQLLTGKTGAAAELGHIPSRDTKGLCGCGNSSCVELFASGKYLQYLCDNDLEHVFIGDVFTKYSKDPIIEKYIQDLAIPIATEINILDPDYIILGGGVIQMKDFPKQQLEDAIHKFARKPFPDKELSFIYSVPSQENGVIGAGIYGLKKNNMCYA